MVIYKITNTINNKVYIGQTTQKLESRWSQHKCHSKASNGKIGRAIRKYGFENFTIEIIDIAVDIDELNKKEEEWILNLDTVKTGYNIGFGGLNHIRSQETKDKMSKSRKGKYKGEDNGFYGKTHTKESLEKMSKSKKITLLGNSNKLGKTHTDDFKEKCKKRMKGNTHRRRAVKCLNNGIVYESIVKACEELGLDNRSVHRVLKGEWKHTKKYKFEYIEH